MSEKMTMLLFVKYPTPGKVKTRLAKDIGEYSATEAYRYFVNDTLNILSQLSIPTIICYSPDALLTDYQTWLGDHQTYLKQEGNELGSRLDNSFKSAFNMGYQKVLVMGSDSPDIPASTLSTAIQKLNTSDTVIGPTTDGGYYLLGLTKQGYTRDLFSDIEWSTEHVFNQTKDKIEKQNLSVSQLPLWSDIDELTDLTELIERNRQTPFAQSDTYSFVTHLFDIVENNKGGHDDRQN
jgi:uncharacterized protein